MAASLLFLIFLSAISTGRAHGKQHNISLHSSLSPHSNLSWMSQSGLFGFGFYSRGHGYGVGIFLVGVAHKTVVWTANRDNPPVTSDAKLVFDGGLVLQSGGNQANVISPGVSAASASMLDSGNFVLYDSSNEIVWQSFDYPTDTVLQGQILSGASRPELFSSASETEHSTGIFCLKMQLDGNLVLYPSESADAWEDSYWETYTYTGGVNVTLHLEDDGHLYLFNGSNIIKVLSPGGNPTKHTLYLMRIDPDGILRLYKHNLTDKYSKVSVLWQSSLDKCSPKGLCGLNAFCATINDQDAICHCIPGFVSVIQGNNTLGCARNFPLGRCGTNDGSSIKYDIQEVMNTVWEDDYFSTLKLLSKDGCKKACLEDCGCEAAMFRDGVCRKQKLPLRYGKRDIYDLNVALIKVSVSTSTLNIEPSIDEPQGSKKRLHMGALMVGVVLISLALVFFAFAGLLVYRNHAVSYRQVPRGENRGLTEDVCLISFSYAQLEQVTNNFNEQIGKGAFGTVYKGTVKQLNGSMLVAVKRLQSVSEEGEREFQNEIKAIGRTHHRNLGRLLGYCLEGSNRLLVYEYMSNGSLSDALFKPENKPSWPERMEIARGIARGILYLHEECETQIIHCDIKPQNILMDESGHARISDFGLAKLLKPDQTRTFTGIRGTRGYVAPEWHKKLPITVKADVYSYGVVLLEIICCRKSVDSNLPEVEAVLEEWVHDCFVSGQIGKVVGDDEKVDKRQLERVVKVGLWCVLEDPSIRPSMKKVLLMLEGTVDIPVPPSPNSFFTAF